MPNVHLVFENDIAMITIDRSEALNALNANVLQELDEAVGKVSGHDSVRCLVITGAGEKSFVAGADIKEIHPLKQREALRFAKKGQAVFRSLEELEIPVIAAVNGFALGGGLELALACDFIYASENAKLGLPEVGLGLIPGFGGTIRLARVVGPSKAKEMIFSGLPITASEALDCGLINKIFPSGTLMEEVKKVAAVIASRGPQALAAAKLTMATTAVMAIDEAMTFEAQKFAGLFKYVDVYEGTQAFIDKRKPHFTGR